MRKMVYAKTAVQEQANLQTKHFTKEFLL